ncbi:peptidyl-prolyl cis-trans isomerase [Thiosulfatimonas sediminis]|uniref:Peptidyl-prolyl cis-trans isomerase n=1 Tax=Thiosulfatimonas sediminis TaxID=2675054 RepID=A0A6F8PUC2_9GAMM|nr:peptidylprolyl isomerase [Thiosulfatimonas sediminis]BBP45742.1 peptidyl-prolyl cis-trans isomerase [Thiosulfatimonas sediminis]
MTRRLFLAFKTAVFGALLTLNFAAQANEQNPQVLIETNKGSILVELYPKQAPKTVENFLGYVNEQFYDGTVFHRVIKNFMVQGGGFDKNLNRKPNHDPIKSEADNGLRNRIGTLAMARTNDPHSASAQFFINTNQNSFLDHREKSSSQAWGYTVFGRVIKGMQVVNEISNTPTGFKNGMGDVPAETIEIIKARQVK